jgi:hypothetical protein
LYRIDIIKNGRHWQDTVGVKATAINIAAVTIGLLAEAAVETTPGPGLHCIAEVFDDGDIPILKAELLLSSDS